MPYTKSANELVAELNHMMATYNEGDTHMDDAKQFADEASALQRHADSMQLVEYDTSGIAPNSFSPILDELKSGEPGFNDKQRALQQHLLGHDPQQAGTRVPVQEVDTGIKVINIEDLGPLDAVSALSSVAMDHSPSSGSS